MFCLHCVPRVRQPQDLNANGDDNDNVHMWRKQAIFMRNGLGQSPNNVQRWPRPATRLKRSFDLQQSGEERAKSPKLPLRSGARYKSRARPRPGKPVTAFFSPPLTTSSYSTRQPPALHLAIAQSSAESQPHTFKLTLLEAARQDTKTSTAPDTPTDYLPPSSTPP